MKKIYFFLALALTFVGASVLHAVYTKGEEVSIEETADLDGKDVLLSYVLNANIDETETDLNSKWSAVYMTASRSGYAAPVAAENPKSNSVWHLNFVKTEDGCAWYTIKSVYNGMYLTYDIDESVDPADIEALSNDENDSSQWWVEGNTANCKLVLKMVEDVAQARLFAFLAPKAALQKAGLWEVASDAAKREAEIVETSDENYNNVFMCTKLTVCGNTYWAFSNRAYNGHMSRYQDYAAHMCIETAEYDPNAMEDLAEYVSLLPVQEYPIGNGPGFATPADLAQRYNEKVAEALAFADNPEANTESAAALLEELKAVAAEAEAGITIQPMTTGYYRLVAPLFASPVAMTVNANHLMRYEGKNVNDAAQVWYFALEGTITEGEDENAVVYETYSMKNMKNNEYFAEADLGKNESDHTTAADKKMLVTVDQAGVGNFVITPINSANGNRVTVRRLHCTGHGGGTSSNGKIVGWSWGGGMDATLWKLENVSADELEVMIEAAKQADRTARFNTLLADAKTALATSKKTNDGLVTSVDQLSSNATDPTQGAIAYLIDGKTDTYWHSSWQGSRPTGIHYLQIDLGQPVSNIGIEYIFRQSASNDHAYSFHVQGTNDEALAADLADTEWVDAWSEDVESDPLPSRNSLGAKPGRVDVELDGAYRYVRIYTTLTNDANGNAYAGIDHVERQDRNYWHLAEIQIYDLNSGAQSQFDQMGQVAIDFEAAVEEAKTVTASAATEEDIAALQAAFDAFRAEFADPTALRTLLSSAQSNANGAIVGPHPFQVPQEAADALVAEVTAVSTWLDENLLGVTKTQLDAKLAELQAAVDAFNAAKNTIQTDRWYYFQYPLEGHDADHANNTYSGHSTGPMNGLPFNGGKATVNMGNMPLGDPAENVAWVLSDEKAQEATDFHPWTQQWRFIPVPETEDTYYIMNRATGLFIPTLNGNQTQFKMTPEKFLVVKQDYDVINFRGLSNNYDIHLAAQNSMFIGWPAEGTTGGSAWEIREAVEDDEVVMIDETETVKIPVTINRMNSFCLPYAVNVTQLLDDGALIYDEVLAVDESAVYMQEFDDEVIPAGKPFFVWADSDGGEAFISYFSFDDELSPSFATEPGTDESGIMKGSFVQRGIEANQKIGTITSATEASFTVEGRTVLAYTAYLLCDGVYGDPDSLDDCVEFVIDGALVDGVAKVKPVVKAAGKVYTITGARVAKAVKGLYIIDGKKVVVK